VHKLSNVLNLAILYIALIKFSDFYEFVDWCDQLAIHFAGLVRTNFSEKTTKNTKSLNLVYR